MRNVISDRFSCCDSCFRSTNAETRVKKDRLQFDKPVSLYG